MNTNIDEVEINGVKYIRKDVAPTLEKSGFSMVRSSTAGVFMGQIVECNLSKGVATLKNARRIWYWDGAASLSQLAIDGTSKPGNCKFPATVSQIALAGVCEIMPCTEKAVASINGVKVWQQ